MHVNLLTRTMYGSITILLIAKHLSIMSPVPI